MSGVKQGEREGALRRYKPYPAYRDSGVEWLGEIPAHWEVRMLKRLATLRAGAAITSDNIEPEGDYPVFGGNGIRGFTNSYTHEGSLPLIGRQGALCGCINLASGKFWASEHAVVAQPEGEVNSLWLTRLLESMSLNSYSQSAAQPGIAVETIGAISAPVPPEREQRAIAAFLDRETARIDALVAKNERLIALLQEQRTALITRAVTKGLDPNVPMKDSGVEWLGEIPAGWELRRLKTTADVQLSNVDKKATEGQEPVRLCNYTDVYYNERITADVDFMAATATPEQVRRFALREGDVLITKDSESWTDIAVPAVVAADLPGVLCGYHLAHIRPKHHCYGPFLARAFSAVGPRDQFQVAANGITRFGLGGDAIATGVFAIPSVPEQRAIAAFLDRETARIDALVAKVRDAISHLHELRTALISAAVTGKIDVREEVA